MVESSNFKGQIIFTVVYVCLLKNEQAPTRHGYDFKMNAIKMLALFNALLSPLFWAVSLALALALP